MFSRRPRGWRDPTNQIPETELSWENFVPRPGEAVLSDAEHHIGQDGIKVRCSDRGCKATFYAIPATAVITTYTRSPEYANVTATCPACHNYTVFFEESRLRSGLDLQFEISLQKGRVPDILRKLYIDNRKSLPQIQDIHRQILSMAPRPSGLLPPPQDPA